MQEIIALRDRGALIVVNHSGGKDSQAMFAVVKDLVPMSQIVVVHADLGKVEWDGAEDKTFLEMVERRGMFPSPQQRQCTGDLKRGPIEREVRRYLKAHPEFGGLVVNCIGLRAEESPGRAKAQVFKKNEGNSIAGCEWFDWLPIHEFTLSQVWRTIADAGQKPHPIYALGMTRFSCRFCVMASRQDLRTAALIDPDTFRAYVRLEERIGRTMMVPVAGIAMGLEAYTGVRLDRSVPDDRPARLLNHQEALL